MNPLKIAIVVPGRFHAFDLARALLARGHDVTVFTNYPGWAAARFGLPGERVHSFTSHGLANRAAAALDRHGLLTFPEARLHSLFGRWAAKQLLRERWDVIHCWSGVSEELLKAPLRQPTLTLLMRGSAHIAVQNRLLQEEEQRAGVVLDKPSEWMLARELREYNLADHLVALSTFARESFLSQGIPTGDVSMLSLGVELSAFRPAAEVVECRCARILNGDALRILYVGTLSFRKGMLDLESIASALEGEHCSLTFVGAVTHEVGSLLQRLGPNVRIVPPKPQAELRRVYEDADLFVFPTIEDGFAMVLAQAKASALPVVVSANCSGRDMISDGEDGWVLPIRRPDAFVDRLRWCLSNRPALAQMVRCTYERLPPRDWSDVAVDFEALSRRVIHEHETVRSRASRSVPGPL